MSTAQLQAQRKAETPLASISPAAAQAIILKSIFYRHLGARPELDDKLRAAYEKRFGRKMRDLLPHETIPAVYLEGPPGQGKTSIHKGAAREFAKLMGLKFHGKITRRQMDSIGMNDYVFSVIELAGETSNKEIGGLMAKVKARNGAEYMGHLPDWRLAAPMCAAYGYVLFDDFATATHQVQNATLGLLLDGAAGDLQFSVNELGQAALKMEGGQLAIDLSAAEDVAEANENAATVHFGLAGNRGTRDGNKTFPITTAIATRVKRYDVEDTVSEWCHRAIERNTDELGDCHMATFVEQNGEKHFLMLAKQENQMMGQSVVSRTLDMLTTEIRTTFAEHGGLGAIMRMDPEKMWEVQFEIEKAAQGLVGKDTASAVAVFYNSLFLGAAPVAAAIIQEGNVDKELIQQKYEDGRTPGGQAFGFALASSLASFAADEIIKIVGRDAKTKAATLNAISNVDSATSKKLRKVFEHFSYGVNQFTNLSMTTLASSKLMQRLAAAAPELFEGDVTYRVPKIDLVNVVAMGMFHDNVKHAKEENMDALTDSLSSWAANNEHAFQNDIIKSIKKRAAPTP